MPEETRICIPGLAIPNSVCMKSTKHWTALASGCPALELHAAWQPSGPDCS